jgi:hypothetical protein
MNFQIISITCLLTLFSNVVFSHTLDIKRECDQSKNIDFKINDIFDLSDSDTIFLHHWANFFHIKTKPVTLSNESAFFLKKCGVVQADLLELERHLRQQKYIRKAVVSEDDSNTIKIETFDNWSLMPTVDFGRKGGVNKYSIGIKDRNLFGLGIDAEIEYFSNDQRTGYKFDTQFPLFLKQNINASIRLTSNDDGSSESVFVQKNFVSFDTPYAYKFGFDNFNQVDTQFQNGLEVARYNHDKSLSTGQWQWLFKDTNAETIRYGFGYTQEKHTFTELLEPLNSTELVTPPQLEFLPLNRDQNYPFISVEYLQKDYRKFTNFNLINQIEDFNMGWQFSALIGKDFSNNLLGPDALWRTSLSKGLQTSPSGYLFFSANFEGEVQNKTSIDDRYLFSFSTEYFHKFNNTWGAYVKNANTLSKNPFYDQPVALGDDSGVRGYPLQYQHGTSTTQFTVEARYYPHINIYKLFELGGAAFIDSGKAFGNSPIANTNSSVLTSVGLGARFYSTHSSEAQVIHLDIVKPLSTDINVNNVEFRITTKHSF